MRAELLCCLVFVLSLVRMAAAQPAGTERDPRLHEALAAYEAGDLARAQELFEAVHREQPTARTLRALGIVAFRQGRHPQAAELLEAGLASQVKPLTPEQAGGARELLAEARRQIEQANATPVPALTAPAASQQVSTVSDSLAADTPAPAAAKRDAERPATRAPAPLRSKRARRLRRTAYGLLATAGAAVVVSAVATGVGVRRVNEIEDTCRGHADGKCFESELEQLDRDNRLQLLSGLSIGGAVVAGVCGAGGALLFFQAYRSEDRRGLDGVGFGIRRAF